MGGSARQRKEFAPGSPATGVLKREGITISMDGHDKGSAVQLWVKSNAT